MDREDDLDRELKSHLDAEAEEQGSPDAAKRAFGNLTRVKEDVRAAWGWTSLERLTQDLRYAARMLRRSPGFAAIALFSLTLGIGANTALFSLLDAVLWKSLPVRDPRELRILTAEQSARTWAPVMNYLGYSHDENGVHVGDSFSYPSYRMFRDNLPQFSDLMAFAGSQFTLTANGASDAANGQFVSGNYFTGLGAPAIAGRAMLPEDDTPGAPYVAVLTYQYWEKRFGLDPAIIGRDVAINRLPVRVVGVMPPAFQGLFPGRAVDLFVPMSMVPAAAPAFYRLNDPSYWWVEIFGRLRPLVSDAAAAEAVRALLARGIEAYAGPPQGQRQFPPVVLMPGARGVGLFRFTHSISLAVLAAVAGMVLLIACANLANLLLARSAARRREIAVRLSVGASRGRLVRQFLTESLLLATFGGGLGLLAAKPLLGVIERLVAGPLPTSLDAHLDARTLAFTLGVSLFTCVLFGILPAWRVTQPKGGTPRLRVSRILVAAQVALSLLLLVGAGLFVRTLERLMQVNLGFRPERILTFQTDATTSGYEGVRLAQFYERIEQRLRSIPGVASATMSEQGLLRGSANNYNFFMPGRTIKPREFASAYLMYCSDPFLSTLQIPLLAGRDLAPADGPGAPAVAVVNEAFIRKYMDGQNPIGRILYLGNSERPRLGAPPIQIVGVAKDAHYSSVRADPPPTAYLPYAQEQRHFGQVTFAIRTDLPPLAVAAAVRRAVAETDSTISVAGLATMDQLVSDSTSSDRLFAELVSGFGLMEALLAAIGLYGVMAYTVARRTQEIGIRLALGSSAAGARWLVLRESLTMVVAGLALGVPLALALTRYIRTMLFGVEPNDVGSYAVAAFLMAVVGAAAAWIPARRASRVDPMVALRYE
jgi:predicted permease